MYGDGGELGYISIEELIECNVELDFNWSASQTLTLVRHGYSIQAIRGMLLQSERAQHTLAVKAGVVPPRT